MHLSPLFSSKKIVLSPLLSGLFFCVHAVYIVPNTRPCTLGIVQQRLCRLALRHVWVIIGPYTEFHLRYTQPICVMADRCAALRAAHPPIKRLLARSWVVPTFLLVGTFFQWSI